MAGIHPDFYQRGPELSVESGGSFSSDPILGPYLRYRLPQNVRDHILTDVKKFGERCLKECQSLADQAEARLPQHVAYDPWGRRIDRIEVSEAWLQLHRVSAEEGLIAIGYERVSGEYSRLHQFSKIYLFHPSSAFYTCPLAMADGAARVIELFGSPEVKARAFKHLTSRDPDQFWTSGQWMTERTGGSDVSSTSTIARASKDGYALFGEKWFTSATTSEMALALAKVEGASDKREGLSLFYLELRDKEGRLRNIRIHRLKDKLGTKALPTAELSLEGVPAILIGEVGDGVKRVTSMLNITRVYNSVTAIGTMARALALAKDYALKREAFGKKLSEQPLHIETLAALETEYQATFVLGFHLIHLLGKDEVGKATAEESTVLRLLTPVLKLWSAKQSIAVVSEVLECFGGIGYIEDTGLPRYLRDSQVFPIWEGTTNVLSLDTLRAVQRENALVPFLKDVEKRLHGVRGESLKVEAERVREAAEELQKRAEKLVLDPELQQTGAREFAFSLARIMAATLLIEFAEAQANEPEGPRFLAVARRFARRPLLTLSLEDLNGEEARRIVF